MKIIYKVGNVIKAPNRVLVHGCNAQGYFNAGVAKQVRETWPDCYKTYREVFENNGLVVGQNVWWQSKDKIVINAITQNHFGLGANFVSYEGIEKCFKEIDLQIPKMMMKFERDAEGNFKNITKPVVDTSELFVTMPKIGSGLGGGDWNKIVEIAEAVFTKVQPIVYVLDKKDIPIQKEGEN